nr:MAG TPA: hypothetical protein [Crassvirales sp.]
MVYLQFCDFPFPTYKVLFGEYNGLEPLLKVL